VELGATPGHARREQHAKVFSNSWSARRLVGLSEMVVTCSPREIRTVAQTSKGFDCAEMR